MEIKTFEFQISCGYGSPVVGVIAWKDSPHVDEHMQKCVKSKDIDKKVNKFLEDAKNEGKKLIDFKDSTYVIDRHNNGGCDTIIRKITLLIE